jgi:hypothetical protein
MRWANPHIRGVLPLLLIRFWETPHYRRTCLGSGYSDDHDDDDYNGNNNNNNNNNNNYNNLIPVFKFLTARSDIQGRVLNVYINKARL